MSAELVVPAGVRIIGPRIGPRPVGAVALIVAEFETDQSDIVTDYFATRTRATVPLAWSKHTRDLFSEMRKAAATFKPTRHLGPGCDVWTARVVYIPEAPGYFIYNGRAIHDGDFDRNPEHESRAFTTQTLAEAWIAEQKPLVRCWHGERLAGYRWQLSRESYSMGSGYYLKAGSGYSTGWTVSKTSQVDGFDARPELRPLVAGTA